MKNAAETKDVIFMIKQQDSDIKCTNRSINTLVKDYSSFVFLVSMKYLKNEKESKQAAIAVLKKLYKCLNTSEISNIKHWLYTEILSFCKA